MWQVWYKVNGIWELSNEHALEIQAQQEAMFLASKGYQVTCNWVD